jgi:hypothetical protein
MDPLEKPWGDSKLFDQISDAFKEALAQAWDEGYESAEIELGGVISGPPNPYREATP